VGKLVKVCDREAQSLRQGWVLAAEHIVLVVGDAAYILHRTKVVLGDENLIVLAEGVGLAKEFLIESHARLCDVEHLFMVDVRDE